MRSFRAARREPKVPKKISSIVNLDGNLRACIQHGGVFVIGWRGALQKKETTSQIKGRHGHLANQDTQRLVPRVPFSVPQVREQQH